MKKKLKSKKAQISIEFALLLAGAVTVASIAGFYYLKSLKKSVINAEISSSSSNAKVNTHTMKEVDTVKEVLNNEQQ